MCHARGRLSTSPTRGWIGHLLDELVQPGVLSFDGRTQLSEVAVEVVERTGGESTRTPLAIDAPNDEPRLLEHFEVSRDRRLGHRQRGGELAGGGFALHQPQQDSSPGRIRKGRESCVEGRCGYHTFI
jgi:hypothetical protein